MRTIRVPIALEERLGGPAVAALVEMFDANNQGCSDYVMIQSAERFERRLAEETSKLRVEMTKLGSDLRQEMHAGFSGLRQEMAAGRFELLKWAFVFWAGQLVTVVGIVALLLRH